MSESVSINVSGMKCGGCENTLNTALSAIEGVLAVKASHQEKKVEVEFDPAKTDLDEIEDAIADAGFSVE
ncbi:cation transporter [Methylomonas sp. SURF-2]|uniref:Cation transporter n=1 Tax=Methylomonas subterranea TaxID=2952225 RepID=A0ABT1TCE3_9GAMM|nr:heavy-metal-associated domain-containing protein [Methylomonas sp. SURF-2]MCQ8103137.1 cation transporter [Methylomonas sp. SURF-2]